MLKRFPFKVECVQTDNGQEFTKRLDNSQNLTSKNILASLKYVTNSLRLTHPGITEKWNALTEKITNTFMRRILSIPSMISLNNYRFITINTTVSHAAPPLVGSY